MSQSITLQPIGIISCERKKLVDDNWGEIISTIRLSSKIFEENATLGLNTFSHIEVIFYMNRVKDEKIITGARRPRNNANWPLTGIIAQRTKNRLNKLGLSRAKIISIDGLTIKVKGLDAIDNTPVIDIKPYMLQFVPKSKNVKQPAWVSELMNQYY